VPPIFDYPNHLARMQVLAEGGSAFYELRWAPIPNLAEDLIVPLLSRLMPLELAAKLFVVASFALLTGGVLWLNRLVAGGWRWWPLGSFLFLYTRTFLWGFLNFLFGVGCALCGVALWLALEERPRWLRIAVSMLLALACYFSHLAAFGVYGLTIVGVEIPPAVDEIRGRRWRAAAARLVVLAPQFILPVGLILIGPQDGGAHVTFTAPWRKVDLLFSVFDNYSRPFDIACFAAVVLLMLGLALSRRLGLDRRLGSALALLAAAYLALPSQLMAGSAADHRLPAAGALLVMAATRLRLPARRWAAILAVAVGALFVARMAVIETMWRSADGVYGALLPGMDKLPQRARVAVAYPPSAINFTAIPTVHFPAMAVVRRDAFVPTLFAEPGQQPIALRLSYDADAAAVQPPLLWAALTGGDPDARAAALRALSPYDYVAFTDRQPVHVPPNPCLMPWFIEPRLWIFAVRRDAGCGSS